LTLTILMGVALPTLAGLLRSYRSNGDAKAVSNQLSLARMRAAANSTQGRLRFNLTASTFQLETYDSTTGQFNVEGAVQRLSSGNGYGFGNLSTPAGAQTSIAQAEQCFDGAGNPISQTACILFNSRGASVDHTGATTANGAIYLNYGANG